MKHIYTTYEISSLYLLKIVMDYTNSPLKIITYLTWKTFLLYNAYKNYKQKYEN